MASLSWPEGLGAMASARMGRRVGVWDIIAGLDSWSVGMLARFLQSSLGHLTELDDHVVDRHILVEVILQWQYFQKGG